MIIATIKAPTRACAGPVLDSDRSQRRLVHWLLFGGILAEGPRELFRYVASN